MNLGAGSLVGNRYELLCQIGEGGFATIFQARDLQLNREVAIKILKPSYLSADEDASRFQREAKVLGQLKHKNIVCTYSFGILDNSTAYLVLEYLQGRSLQSLLNEKGSLPSGQIFTIFEQICKGLSFVHDAGIIHRDLSPANIFLSNDNTGELCVKILDFGLSKRISPAEGNGPSTTLTVTGTVMGNPPYMSPELIKNIRNIDLRSDIYALGCVMYECLTGNKTFEADSSMGVIYKHLNDYPAEPLIEPNNSEKQTFRLLKNIILRCLQKDANLRFRNCEEITALLSNEEATATEEMAGTLAGWGKCGAAQAQRRSFLPQIAFCILGTCSCLLLLLLIGLNQARVHKALGPKPALIPLKSLNFTSDPKSVSYVQMLQEYERLKGKREDEFQVTHRLQDWYDYAIKHRETMSAEEELELVKTLESAWCLLGHANLANKVITDGINSLQGRIDNISLARLLIRKNVICQGTNIEMQAEYQRKLESVVNSVENSKTDNSDVSLGYMHVELANLRMRENRLKEALELLQKSELPLDGDTQFRINELLRMKAECLYRLNRPEDAIKASLEAKQLSLKIWNSGMDSVYDNYRTQFIPVMFAERVGKYDIALRLMAPLLAMKGQSRVFRARMLSDHAELLVSALGDPKRTTRSGDSAQLEQAVNEFIEASKQYRMMSKANLERTCLVWAWACRKLAGQDAGDELLQRAEIVDPKLSAAERAAALAEELRDAGGALATKGWPYSKMFYRQALAKLDNIQGLDELRQQLKELAK